MINHEGMNAHTRTLVGNPPLQSFHLVWSQPKPVTQRSASSRTSGCVRIYSSRVSSTSVGGRVSDGVVMVGQSK